MINLPTFACFISFPHVPPEYIEPCFFTEHSNLVCRQTRLIDRVIYLQLTSLGLWGHPKDERLPTEGLFPGIMQWEIGTLPEKPA